LETYANAAHYPHVTSGIRIRFMYPEYP